MSKASSDAAKGQQEKDELLPLIDRTEKIVAIGDIHGCSVALAALVEAIRLGPGDTLIGLGDYIDFGLDSRGVLDQLIALGRRCCLVPLLGNHEELLLAARSDRSALRRWLEFGGVTTLDSYGFGGGLEMISQGHWAFLESCRDFYETDTHILAHASYLPDLPMGQQPPQVLRWEFVDARRPGPHRCGKVVVVGHTAQESGEILDLGYLKCIDTFCHGGGWLTALEVHTGQVWQANERGGLRR